MDKKEPYRWSIPLLVALGVVLLGGGIYIGVVSREALIVNNNKSNKTIQTLVENPSKNQKFKLDQYCQIWLQDNEKIPVMLGTVTDDLMNKTEDQIKEILKEKYPDKEVSTMNKYQIILKSSKDTDKSRANKYTLEDEDGYVSVFKYDKEGKKELVEKTAIQIKSLPKSVQTQIEDVIVVDNEDDAYNRLENFES